MKGRWWLLVFCLALGGLLYFGLSRRQRTAAAAAAATPRAARVERGDLRVIVEATGRVVPEREVEIKCKASGEILALPVDLSDLVSRGDLLLQLNPVDEQRATRQAECALEVSLARLAQARLARDSALLDLAHEERLAESARTSAATRLAEAKARLERVARLLERNMASPEEAETARTTFSQALADSDGALAALANLASTRLQIESRLQEITAAEAGVAADKSALEQARQRLADTRVVAPLDGVVASRNVQVGQIIASGVSNVGGGTAVMTLADLSRTYVLAAVDESGIGRVACGQRVRITVDAFPETVFPGEVVRVGTKGQTTSNIVTFEVKIEVRGPRRELLKPEMTANVTITVAEREGALLLPVGAVQRRRGEATVSLKLADGKSESRTVEVGVSDGEKLEILSGLEEGQEVVLPAEGAGGNWRSGQSRDRERRPPMPPHL